MSKKLYTLGEEIFNSVSHGVGTLLAIGGMVVLIVFSAIYADAWTVVSASIYGATLTILYAMSTLYHSLTNNKAKKFFRIMDHNSIFLLIAGTYTPFTLVALRGGLGWTLFGIVWGATVLGVIFNSINLEKYKKISLVCYIAMGWVIIMAIKPMIAALPIVSLIFLVLGGICYTGGVVFYAIKKIRYFHSVWHLFVLAGSILHYFSVLFMVIK